MRQAFVASTTLRPMAQQLIQDRTPAAYTGVESFARTHAKEDAGALAWLVVILVVIALVLALGVFVQRRRRAGGVIATRRKKK